MCLIFKVSLCRCYQAGVSKTPPISPRLLKKLLSFDGYYSVKITEGTLSAVWLESTCLPADEKHFCISEGSVNAAWELWVSVIQYFLSSHKSPISLVWSPANGMLLTVTLFFHTPRWPSLLAASTLSSFNSFSERLKMFFSRRELLLTLNSARHLPPALPRRPHTHLHAAFIWLL